MRNEGIYKVGKEFGKVSQLFAKQKLLRNGPSRETLAKLIAWHDSSSFSHVLHTWPFRGLLLTS